MSNFLGRSRHISIYSLGPRANSLNACNFLLQVQPAVRHGLREINSQSTRHVLIEVALMSYLLGMGFDFRTARAIVETWETDETLLTDGILSE